MIDFIRKFLEKREEKFKTKKMMEWYQFHFENIQKYPTRKACQLAKRQRQEIESVRVQILHTEHPERKKRLIKHVELGERLLRLIDERLRRSLRIVS